VKNDGLCAKVAFAIQNQRYLWNEAVWSQTYYTECLYRNSRAATIGDKSSDLGWTLAYFPGSKFFSTTDISHAFCQSATTFGDVGQFKLIPRTLWTLVRRSRDTRRRHASVLHWYTCKVVFRQFPHVAVADSFSVLSTHYVARGLGARFSVQVPSIARWFPTRARPCCIPTVPLHYILSNKSRFAVRTQQSGGQIIHNLKTRHRASTSMYSLTIGVRVILP